MTRDRREGWEWKVADPTQSAHLRLLYEPGNWGDVLKGEWAAILTRTAARPGRPFRLVDTFAGAPSYPLVAAARRRLETAPAPEYVHLQSRWRETGELGSTASLVLAAASEAGADPKLLVFDSDPARLAAWSSVREAETISATDGAEALLTALRGPPPDLVVIDPYDLIDRWGPLLEAALRAATQTPVLLYAYNKSPRGGGHARSYESLRKSLRSGLKAGVQGLLGRLGSDAILPRAWHEVIALIPTVQLELVHADLRAAARRLAVHLAEQGVIEELHPTIET